MTIDIEGLVFVGVVLARLLVPLTIPRFPLPGIVASLLIDAVDHSVFEILIDRELTGYQSYDKALDIYYLAIAYVSTLRNWTNPFAFETSRFLWYYRLVGSTAFELTNWRWLLLVFPNTFEYFFIAYSLVALRWNPRRLARNVVLGMAASIWIFIKLPQEYWIHVAQRDATDFIKGSILGVTPSTRWTTAIVENLWVVPALLVVAALVVLLAHWIRRYLPTPDWRVSIMSRVEVPIIPAITNRAARQPLIWLVEKIVLVGLITVIFSQMIPSIDASPIQIVIAVAVLIVANSFVSHGFASRGTHWRSTLTEFLGMSAINFGIAVSYIVLLPFSDGDVGITQLLFLIFLLTLIVTLYDRYRPIHDWHVDAARQAEPDRHIESTDGRLLPERPAG